MLNADSSTLKNESDVQRSAAPPMIPSVAAFRRTELTRFTMRTIGTPGSACLIWRTRKVDSSARPVRPRSDRARNVSGTKESSAKYATIAARCVPRSAKNFCTRVRFRTRTARSMACVSVSPSMDAAQALADLTEISSQIESAALFGEDGAVGASTFADETRAQAFVRVARELLDAAAGLRSSASPNQVEVATAEGSVFVVRDDGRLIAATTTPEPTVGLVFYDLKSCLRAAGTGGEEPQPKPKRRPPRKDDDGA